jgi:hypothetical protein
MLSRMTNRELVAAAKHQLLFSGITGRQYAQRLASHTPAPIWDKAWALLDQVEDASPPASSVAAKLGVFLGNSNAGRLPLYDRWLGKPTQYVLDFADGSSWVGAMAPPWTTDPYKGSGLTLVLSIPLPGGDLAGVADGVYDGAFVACAQRLAAVGAIARPWWEFNGAWEPWFAGKDPALFIAAWKKMYAPFKALGVPVCWCPSQGVNGVHWLMAWPGAGFVDIVGADVYDEDWSVQPDPVKRWDNIYNGNAGVKQLMTLARSAGKKFLLGEWGCIEARTNGTAGGDNPYFIERIVADVLADPITLCGCYFDVQAADGHHALSNVTINNTGTDNSALVKSATRYKELANA